MQKGERGKRALAGFLLLSVFGAITPEPVRAENTVDADFLVQTVVPYAGISQWSGNRLSEHQNTDATYLGQRGIQISSPARVHFIVVFPDTNDENFISCTETTLGKNVLSVFFGEGILPWDGTQFEAVAETPRSDGGCVYKNTTGVFVYPGPTFNLILNGGYGKRTGVEYHGTTESVGTEHGTAYYSSPNGLEWGEPATEMTSLKFVLGMETEAPREDTSFALPTYTPTLGTGITIEDLQKHLVLAQGTETIGTPDESVGFDAQINVSKYFKNSGTLRYLYAPIGHVSYAPDKETGFRIKNRDCVTPSKRLFEWDIPNRSRGSETHMVLIGPFEGTECAFTPAPTLAPWENQLQLEATNPVVTPQLVIAGSDSSMMVTLYAEELAPMHASSVLFLPGIKGSNLYRESTNCDFFFFDCEEERLWPPVGARDIADLHLDSFGNSLQEVYAREESLLASFAGLDFYQSFMDEMQSLETANTITEFKPIAYDWRLSLQDLVSKGTVEDGKVFYGRSTDTPYIEQELRRLASESHTGKVTMVAHSNGGLVAKALMQRIGDIETATLVDDVIFVGVPQSGAPQAVGSLLFGYGEAIPIDACATEWYGFLCSLLVERGEARTLAENTPMAYHLLPSQTYFDSLNDTEHPVGLFSGINAYANEFVAYGDTIESFSELARFLRAEDGGRTKPASDDVKSANILNASLISYADTTHQTLDVWRPPSGVTLHQIAGWGVDTISGIEFAEYAGPFTQWIKIYRPMFVEDGDKVVPVPSALMTPASDNVKSYWVDLSEYTAQTDITVDHANILKIPNVSSFIKNLLVSLESPDEILRDTQPETNNIHKKLRFILHAEASIKVTDRSQNQTSYQNQIFTNTIPEAEYGEFGVVKYVTVPDISTYTITIQSPKEEKVVLDVERVEKGRVKKRSTVTNIPTTPSNSIEVVIPETTEEVPEEVLVKIDEDADGIPEQEIQIPEGVVFAVPEVGQKESIETATETSRNSGSSSKEPEPTEETLIEERNHVLEDTEVAVEGAVGIVLGTSTSLEIAEDTPSKVPVTVYQEKEVGVWKKLNTFFATLMERMLSFFRTLFA